jgi:DNA polymerase
VPVAARAPRAQTPKTGAEDLAAIRADLGDCRRCKLCEGRTNIVFGVGSPSARLVVVGEGPGFHEDRTGEPFVGRAGQLLTRMLAAIGLRRDEVYIANVVKCRPPENRDPQPDEIAACSPFLVRQLEAIAPDLIVTVGRFSSQVICGLDVSIGRLRGTVRSFRGVPVVVTYHPAYLLRNPAAKRQAWEDLLVARAVLRGDRAAT